MSNCFPIRRSKRSNIPSFQNTRKLQLFGLMAFIFLMVSPAHALTAQDVRLLCSGLGTRVAQSDDAEFSVSENGLRASKANGKLSVYEGDRLILEIDDFSYEQYTECVIKLLDSEEKDISSLINIEVQTADVHKAGTDSRLYFYIIDTSGNTLETIFTDGGAGDEDRVLEQALTDVFYGTKAVSRRPAFLRIKMEMEGSGRHWLGEKIRVNAPDMDFSACANLRNTIGWLTSTNLQSPNIKLAACR